MTKPFPSPYIVNAKGATAANDVRANNAAHRAIAEEALQRREAEQRNAAATAAAKAFIK